MNFELAMNGIPLDHPLERILESVDQGIVVCDAKFRVFFWNNVIQTNFFADPVVDAHGYNLRQIFPSFWEEIQNKIWADTLIKDVLHNGHSKCFSRFPLPTCDHKTHYFDIKSAPLYDANQKIWGTVLLFHDVTDNISLENRLLRQARTTSLANLGASIAHEIRNPLNSISLNIQLIREWLQTPQESSQEEIISTLDNVLTEIRRLDELIRYFLRFSRPPEPQFSEGNPNDAVKQATRLLEEQAKKNKVDMILQLNALPNVFLDRNQISQAVYNICLNGIQALKEQGGGHLEITTRNHSDYVVIEIKDDGLGLTESALSNLFTLFFTTKEDGSGLGLPIANQIVERHDGRIVAENNLDKGACFTIYLPVVYTCP